MSDDTVECEYCGEEFKSQGLATHQRFCDEKPDEEQDGHDSSTDAISDEESPEDDDTTTRDNRSGRWSDFEADVVDRDNGECRRCSSDENLVVHTVDPDGKQRLQNALTLCEECDAYVEDFHPRTKRTAIHESV